MGKKSKSKSSGGGGAARGDGFSHDPALQAVILADSYTTALRPFSLHDSEVMLPVLGVPLLEYAVEFLVASGVREVLVASTHSIDSVEAACVDMKRRRRALAVASVTVFPVSDCTNVGEVLRELDRDGVLRGDFVLLEGGAVTTMNLRSMLAAHSARREADKNVIMTVAFKALQPVHRSRQPEDDTVVAITPCAQQRIVFYDNSVRDSMARLPAALFLEHPAVKLRYDLVDAGVYILTLPALQQFSENFDFQSIRRQFLPNMALNRDLGFKLSAHVLSGDEYAMVVRDARSYGALTQDIISRWTYPIVPESPLLAARSLSFRRGNVYKGLGVKLARSSRLKRNVVVGKLSQLGERAVVDASVLGCRCVLGADVTVTGSILWDDVIVEDGATVQDAIIASGAVIRAGAVVSGGACIGPGVIIDAGVRLAEAVRIGVLPEPDPFADEEEGADRASSDPHVVGPAGVGLLWRPLDDDSDVDSDLSDAPALDVDTRLWSVLGRKETIHERVALWKAWEDAERAAEAEDDDDDDMDGWAESRFVRGVREIVTPAVDLAAMTLVDSDALKIELSMYKSAENKSFSELIKASLPCILTMAVAGEQTQMQLVMRANALLKLFLSVLLAFNVSQEEERAYVDALHELCLEHDNFRPTFRYLLQILYDLELAGEDAILAWAEEMRSYPEDVLERSLFDRPDTQELLAYLEEEEEEEEESEEEEEEEESGEEEEEESEEEEDDD